MGERRMLILMGVLSVLAGSKLLMGGDLSPAAHLQKPNELAGKVVGKRQIEGHTCGFHCLETIYEAHGVNPSRAGLRDRLGVDETALPFAKDSTGSLHPDIYRVAFQDGFLPEALDLENPYFEEKLHDHLDKGCLAMALFKKKDSGILHWVVLSEVSTEKVRIVDSLYLKPYWKTFAVFLEEEALSVIMFSVPKDKPRWKIGEIHRSGVAEMNRVRKRLRKRK